MDKPYKEIMNFEVNGISFSKEELNVISISSLSVGRISHSHLFFIPPSNKNAFLVLRAGDYIEQAFVDKYTNKGIVSFYSLEVASIEEIQKYNSFFKEWITSYDEKKRQVAAQKIIKEFGNDFWKLSQSSYLSFVLVCFENFYKLPSSVVETYQSSSLTMYSRATISASLSVITCLIHRIVDPLFVRDLYNIVFALDFGLVFTGDFTYSLALACESERKNPGTGIDFLKNMNRSENEIQTFTEHPLISASYIENLSGLFAYPEVSNIIQFHHEKADGSGFPGEISYSGLADIETFLMFCDYIIPFSEHIYQKGDGYKLTKVNFEDLKNSEYISSLPINKILSYWEAAMDWAIEKRVNHQEQVA